MRCFEQARTILGGAVVGAFFCVAAAAHAGTVPFTIGAFSLDRTAGYYSTYEQQYKHRPFDGSDTVGGYDQIRSTLLDPSELYKAGGHSYPAPGPGDQYQVQYDWESGGSLIDNAGIYDLDRLDLLVMSEVAPLTQDQVGQGDLATARSAEYDAIADFVRGGGCLVIVTDYRDESQDQTTSEAMREMANGVLGALDGGNGDAGRFTEDVAGATQTAGAGYFVNSPGSTVLEGQFPYYDDGTAWDETSGPGGTELAQDAFPGAASLAASLNLGIDTVPDGWAEVIAKRDRNAVDSPIVAEIQLDEINQGSGGVLLVSDVLFINRYIFGDEGPGASGRDNTNNSALLLNFIAQQMGGDTPDIPEPGFVVLLVSGLMAAGIISFRRRRRA